jgi:hypothetical protein
MLLLDVEVRGRLAGPSLYSRREKIMDGYRTGKLEKAHVTLREEDTPN